MAENVRVIVRCRPMNKREHALKCANILDIDDCTLSIRNPNDGQAPPKSFTYDVVYNEVATTEIIYNDVCYSLVDSVLEGYNATIFAYGQTGCGKTHTMQGPECENSHSFTNKDNHAVDNHRGIIARSFDQIFEAISLAKEQRFLVLVSYLEIYNEIIRDLLSPSQNPHDSYSVNHILKELPGVGVVVPTLSTHTVHNATECYALLNVGNKRRAQAATLMNATSSRSHTIFTVSLEQIENVAEDTDTATVLGQSASIRRGKLNLVDLAGSERQNKTGAAGERLREATKINLSLSALGNVISALVDGKTKHIPYRDSKLTRLLQDSLGGNTKTLMIACVSPANNNYDETISTLRYAARAKNIANKPLINEDPKDAKLREYQDEIAKLKKLLDETTKVHEEIPSNPPEELFLRSEENTEKIHAGEDKKEIEREEGNQVMEEFSQSAKSNTTKISEHVKRDEAIIQMEALQRIERIKKALIGGERASDTQLRERRQRRKLAAERRVSALAQALSRVTEGEDRDLLQIHYTSIAQELQAKNEYLKRARQKIKVLEQEVNDLQAEFQLDRADYLDTIRRLERQLKFYQQIMELGLPILRKAGTYWDLDEILQNAVWNDDLKVWKLPDNLLNVFKLPPTEISPPSVSAINRTATPRGRATSTFYKAGRRAQRTRHQNYFDEAVFNATTAFTTRSGEKPPVDEDKNEDKMNYECDDELDEDCKWAKSKLSTKNTNFLNYYLPQQQQHRERSKTATMTTAAPPSTQMSREFLTRWRDFAHRHQMQGSE